MLLRRHDTALTELGIGSPRKRPDRATPVVLRCPRSNRRQVGGPSARVQSCPLRVESDFRDLARPVFSRYSRATNFRSTSITNRRHAEASFGTVASVVCILLPPTVTSIRSIFIPKLPSLMRS